MARILRTVLLAGGLAVTAHLAMAPVAQACPMCKAALEDPDPGDPTAASRPKAYMYSILFMISMPASLFTAFSLSFYRLSRKQQRINASLLEESGEDIFIG